MNVISHWELSMDHLLILYLVFFILELATGGRHWVSGFGEIYVDFVVPFSGMDTVVQQALVVCISGLESIRNARCVRPIRWVSSEPHELLSSIDETC